MGQPIEFDQLVLRSDHEFVPFDTPQKIHQLLEYIGQATVRISELDPTVPHLVFVKLVDY